MHWFLRIPRLEAALAGFRGARIEDDVLGVRVWEGEGGGGWEGEEEDEGLREMGEVHGRSVGLG